jgi:hypothetical protein
VAYAPYLHGDHSIVCVKLANQPPERRPVREPKPAESVHLSCQLSPPNQIRKGSSRVGLRKQGSERVYLIRGPTRVPHRDVGKRAGF